MPKGNGIVSVENGAVVIHSVWVGLGWGEVSVCNWIAAC